MSFLDFSQIPADKPVVIHCSYRTGSTALCDFIASQSHRYNFDEAFHHTLFKDRHKKFKEYVKTNNDYVWKFMPDQVRPYNRLEIFNLVNKSYVIKLRRVNLVDQITSWIISYRTNKWHVTADDSIDQYEVPRFTDNWLLGHIKLIMKNNRKVDEFIPDHEADVILHYETIKNQIHSKYVSRPRPTNYDEVYERVSIAVDKIVGDKNA